ncbi:MAG: hypothetical protein HY056_08550 [Proteobacteria bacterium]|nr:hypothetical protein [Pseudomonadota bacterium]
MIRVDEMIGRLTLNRGRCSRVLALLLAAACAGCGSASVLTGGLSSDQGWFGSRLGTFFTRGGAKDASASADTPRVDVECPSVTVREGAATLLVNTPNTDPTPTNLRYQGTIGQTARECAVRGTTFTMRVGVQGRVILGPLGGPGQVDIPLRYALVREGTQSKTIWTKLNRFTVTIPPDAANVPFTHIEEDITVSLPPGNEIDSYIVYVGFDPKAVEEKPKPERRKRNAPRSAQRVQ